MTLEERVLNPSYENWRTAVNIFPATEKYVEEFGSRWRQALSRWEGRSLSSIQNLVAGEFRSSVNLYFIDVDERFRQQLILGSRENLLGVPWCWIPDGSGLVFLTNIGTDESPGSIVIEAGLDGSSVPVYAGRHEMTGISYSPDGKSFLFTGSEEPGSSLDKEANSKNGYFTKPLYLHRFQDRTTTAITEGLMGGIDNIHWSPNSRIIAGRVSISEMEFGQLKRDGVRNGLLIWSEKDHQLIKPWGGKAYGFVSNDELVVAGYDLGRADFDYYTINYRTMRKRKVFGLFDDGIEIILSPDRKTIAIQKKAHGVYTPVSVKPLYRDGKEILVPGNTIPRILSCWSPDSRMIITHGVPGESKFVIDTETSQIDLIDDHFPSIFASYPRFNEKPRPRMVTRGGALSRIWRYFT